MIMMMTMMTTIIITVETSHVITNNILFIATVTMQLKRLLAAGMVSGYVTLVILKTVYTI